MAERKRVLLIEDNIHLNEINKRALEREGYIVQTAPTLAKAREILYSADVPDVVILDIMMPDGSGVSFCKEVRQRVTAPILFLTSVSGYEQMLRGLAAGGDDYLNKPYDLNLLLAKVAAFLRRDDLVSRAYAKKKDAMVIGSLVLDTLAQQACLDGEDLALTHKEFSLLHLLASKKNTCIPSDELYESVWGGSMQKDTHALKTTIWRLRKKLVNSNMEIISVRGEGYVFECRDDPSSIENMEL